ncbi:MAG: tRNA uridine-5-carboxymethylaminomethyl(34) synthesis GTPase MnmE [bacterium]|nr:tRNA uridine-5-carboxymethylaminomethyl(34) synthesis GTPase MnmE [bacterium]
MSRFEDTIVGPATAPGEAGVGILRLSGPRALAVATAIFRPKGQFPPQSWRFYFGWVFDQDREIDEALMVYMQGPKSYTAEDVVEIHCHGGGVILKKIIQLTLNQGARLASPGEFTQRAFVNGRIDLTQAEAVGDMVRAKTERALNMVVNQLKGALYRRINELKEEVAWVLALVNAGIDFPEEDVVFSHQEEITAKLQRVESALATLVASAEGAMALKEGFRLVLVGRPNVGKSSLMNALLQEARAIVTDIPGTTRDSIAESLQIEGVPIRLVDTAGLRETQDRIEIEGIERSWAEMEAADLVLWVVDASDPDFTLSLPEAELSREIPKLLVFNKMDRAATAPAVPAEWAALERIEMSAKEAEDVERLRERIYCYITGRYGELAEDALLTNLRQQEAAAKAEAAVGHALENVSSGTGEEVLSLDLAEALDALGEIVGETTPDDMMNRIFENFCIGK